MPPARQLGPRIGSSMPFRLAPLALLILFASAPAFAQFGPSGPPAVGVVKAVREPITESSQFVGRIQAVNRVAIVARVTAFLDKRFFTEGTEVKAGDLLYRLEQPPFQADVEAKQAAVAQANAQLANATIALNRAQALLNTPAGPRSSAATRRWSRGRRPICRPRRSISDTPRSMRRSTG